MYGRLARRKNPLGLVAVLQMNFHLWPLHCTDCRLIKNASKGRTQALSDVWTLLDRRNGTTPWRWAAA
jgi:hypothetical protein